MLLPSSKYLYLYLAPLYMYSFQLCIWPGGRGGVCRRDVVSCSDSGWSPLAPSWHNTISWGAANSTIFISRISWTQFWDVTWYLFLCLRICKRNCRTNTIIAGVTAFLIISRQLRWNFRWKWGLSWLKESGVGDKLELVFIQNCPSSPAGLSR